MIVAYPLNFNNIPSPNFVLESRPEPVTSGTPGRLYLNSQTRLPELWNGLRTLVLGAPADAGAVPGSLALRDEAGALSATAFKGPLTGNADSASLAANSSLLGGETGSYYRARGNHTGSQLAGTISDLPASIQATRLDQFALPAAPINLNNFKVINLGQPEAENDAATKRYVDNYLAFTTGAYLPFAIYDPGQTGKVGYSVNADLLAGAGAGYYLDRGNHSGVQLSSTISDFLARVRTVSVTALAAPTRTLSLNGFKIITLGDPQDPADAATKNYVDRSLALSTTAPQWNSIEGIPPLRQTFAPLPFSHDVAPEQTEACGYHQYFFSSTFGWRRVPSLPLRQWVAAPASSAAGGRLGATAYDSGYFYACVGPNQWRRVTLESWGGNYPFSAFAPAPEGHTFSEGRHFYLATGTNTWMRFALEEFSAVTAPGGVPSQSYYPGYPEFEAIDPNGEWWYYCWEANRWARAALNNF